MSAAVSHRMDALLAACCGAAASSPGPSPPPTIRHSRLRPVWTGQRGGVYSPYLSGLPHARRPGGTSARATIRSSPGEATLRSWQVCRATVLNGRNGMPPFGLRPTRCSKPAPHTILSDAQIADIVNYIRSHFGNN